MTVGFAVIISYTVALSFIPSLSARTLKKGESKFYNLTEPIFKFIEKVYDYILKFVLRFKVITLIVVFAVFFGSLSLFPKIGMNFIPKEDKSEFEIKIKANASVSLEEMIKKLFVVAVGMVLMGLASLFLPMFNQLADSNISFDFSDVYLISLLFGITVLTIITAGTFPAFYLTKFN